MALTHKEREINGVLFLVQQFPARRAFILQAKLIKLLGPAIGAALGKANVRAGMDGDVDISGALQKLADNLDPEAALSLARDLLSCTRANGKELSNDAVFDDTFGAGMLLIYKACAFSVEVNFSDFFGTGGIGALAARFVKPEAPDLSAP